MNFYSLIVLLSISLLIYFTYKKSVHIKGNETIPEENFWKITFWVILASSLGAKIFHLLENFSTYSANPNLIEVSKGFSILGAIVFGYSTILIFENRQKINLNKIKNSIFLYLPIAQSLGRVGNITNNELLPYSYYEIILNLLNFVILKKVFSKNPDKVIYFFFLNYGIIRVLIEIIKGNVFNFLFFISILFIIYGFLGLYHLKFKR